jgi:hypothetical protein
MKGFPHCMNGEAGLRHLFDTVIPAPIFFLFKRLLTFLFSQTVVSKRFLFQKLLVYFTNARYWFVIPRTL